MKGFFRKYFNKKNNKKMDTERLISLKENFTNQRFQWVKTTDANLLGKIVKCKDIQPRGRSFIAVFNDGSSIPTDKLNRNLMMITEGMQPLTKAEVQAIAGPPVTQKSPLNNVNPTGPTGSGPINMPDELKQFQTPESEKVKPSQTMQSSQTTERHFTPKQEETNMFSMFNAEETNINVAVTLKLPNKKLLKMMYENADDKEKFLLDLSQYVHSKINKDIVKGSLEKMLVPASKKTKSNPQKTTEVIVTEVDENNE